MYIPLGTHTLNALVIIPPGTGKHDPQKVRENDSPRYGKADPPTEPGTGKQAPQTSNLLKILTFPKKKNTI